MYFFDEKLERRIEEIKGYIIEEKMPIEEFMVSAGNDLDGYKAPVDSSWRPFKTSEPWGTGPASYQWFRASFEVPPSWAGRHVAIELFTPGDIAWAGSAEYSVYVDGIFVAGADVFHRHFTVSDCAASGERHELAFLGFSGYKERRATTSCALVAIDDAAAKCYYDFLNAYEAVRYSAAPDAPDVLKMKEAVNAAINLVDFRKAGSKECRASLKKASEYLEENIYKKQHSNTGIEVTGIGHTHLDVAWLWRLEQTREKAARDFATADRLMSRYPEFVFIQSQPQVYEFTKQNYPELYERVKKRVKEGRIEPEGGMWVEADCNLISGESMVRQFLVGKQFFRDEFGVDNKILWLPDVFGYSAAMPQILVGCGIRYFMTTKISWNQFNRLPMDTFYLQGIDGSKVLTHFMTTPNASGPGDGNPLPFLKTYNGEVKAETVIHSWDTYKQKDANTDLLLAFGYGDGGGGPNATMLENAKRLKDLPGVPRFKQGTALSYFARLEKTLEGKDVPTWAGELYLEFHRGTYTSMAQNKRYNRKTEFLYHNAEALSSIAEALAGMAYPSERLKSDWKVILVNQFHDIIPGSSIGPVYEDSKKQYEALAASGGEMAKGAVAALLENIGRAGPSVVVFNTTGGASSSLVRAMLPQSVKAVERSGEAFPVQRLSDGSSIFFAKDVPHYGYAVYAAKEIALHNDAGMLASTTLLENRFFRIEFAQDGTISSLFDKRVGRNIITAGMRANVIESYEDKPMKYNCWDIDIYYKEKCWPVDDLSEICVEEAGPVVCTLRVVRKYLSSTITQRISIYADVPRIDFDTEIDWHEQEILLKAAFPVDINSSRAAYEIQFGAVERNTHFNTSWDVAKFETCAHKWADLSESGYGVSLLNDCKYGHDIHCGVMRLTLLKSGIYPNKDADKGRHRFVYSLFPHIGGWEEAGTVAAAYALNNPFAAEYASAASGPLGKEFSFVNVDNERIVIDTVKKAENEDAYIIRLYESTNSHSRGVLRFFKAPAYLAECSMMEDGDKPVSITCDALPIEMRPYEIRTYKARF